MAHFVIAYFHPSKGKTTELEQVEAISPGMAREKLRERFGDDLEIMYTFDSGVVGPADPDAQLDFSKLRKPQLLPKDAVVHGQFDLYGVLRISLGEAGNSIGAVEHYFGMVNVGGDPMDVLELFGMLHQVRNLILDFPAMGMNISTDVVSFDREEYWPAEVLTGDGLTIFQMESKRT